MSKNIVEESMQFMPKGFVEEARIISDAGLRAMENDIRRVLSPLRDREKFPFDNERKIGYLGNPNSVNNTRIDHVLAIIHEV